MSKAIGRSKLSGDARAKLEGIVARFEEACHRGERPSIDDYIPLHDHDRQAVLTELVQAEVEFRVKANDAVQVETYLKRYPELSKDRDAAIELIVAEYELRRRRDSRITPEEYLRRFPQYRDELITHLMAPTVRPRRSPIRLNCPHCQNPIEIVHNAEEEEEVLCPSCGSTFRLDTERTYTWSPERLPRLGKFELLEVLGHGAFGTVYRARDTDLDRIVAVKVPRSGQFATKEDEDRFVREARAAASLRHPGVVPVYEVGRSDTFPYIVAEYIAGITLSDAMSAQQFGFREAAEIIAQVADALEDAHQNGVVHRDIKPSNIMLESGPAESSATTVRRSMAHLDSQRGDDTVRSASDLRSASYSSVGRRSVLRFRPRLMDFGLARRDEGEVTMTMEGQILGTPSYMSPEQAKGEAHRVDGRSDVYSLGVILYRMLVGELPFRGNNRMLLHQVLHDEPRAPRKLNDRIPRDLETITLKCLAKEPARRFQSAADLAADLRRWMDGEPIEARPVGPVERVWRWCKRNPGTAGLISSVTTLLLIITAVSTYAAITIKRERDETRKARDEAFKSADMLTTVGEDLSEIPLVQEARRDLLIKALDFYENVMANRLDPSMRQRKGMLFHRLGDVYEALHQHGKADEAYQKAIGMFGELATEYPSEQDYRHHLARSYDYFGEMLRKNTARLEEAEHAYQKALALQSKLIGESPGTAKYRQELARTENNYGLLLSAIERPKEAEKNFRQAISRLESLIEGSENPVYQYELARTYVNLGLNVQNLELSDERRSFDAEAAYRKAITLLVDLLKPPNKPKPNYRLALAAGYLNLGNLFLSGSARVEDAIEAYSRSLEVMSHLVAEFPSAPLYRSEQGNTFNSRAHAYWKAQRDFEARGDWVRAREILEKLVTDYATVPDYQSRLGMAIGGSALPLLKDGNFTEAREVLDEAIRHQRAALDANPQSREYRRRLAYHYGDLAVAVLGLGEADSAMELLKKAVANDYPIEELRNEKGLGALHDREDFQRLLSRSESH